MLVTHTFSSVRLTRKCTRKIVMLARFLITSCVDLYLSRAFCVALCVKMKDSATRLSQLTNKHGVSTHDVPEKLHVFVFGSNFDPSDKRPRTSPEALRQASKSLRWAEQQLQESNFVIALEHLGGTLKHDDLLSSLLEFYYAHGTDSSLYVQFQTLTHSVFHLQGELIASYVGTSRFAADMSCLPYMQKAVKVLRQRGGNDDVATDINERRSQLQHKLSNFGITNIDRLAPVRGRLTRYDHFPDHFSFTPEKTAEKLYDFIKTYHQTDQRLQRIRREFQMWDTHADLTHEMTQAYVKGLEDLDVEEVVAIILVNKALIAAGRDSDATLSIRAEIYVRHLFLVQLYTWQTAVAAVISLIATDSL